MKEKIIIDKMLRYLTKVVEYCQGYNYDQFVKDEKTWYRVIAGSFKDKNLAEQRVKNLSAKGYDGGFVTAFRK